MILLFKNTTAHANADTLSRLQLPVEPAKTSTPPEMVLLLEHLEESPVTANDIRVWTSRDPKLSTVLCEGDPELSICFPDAWNCQHL